MKKFAVRAGCGLSILLCVLSIYPAYIIAMELENESQGQVFSEYYVFDAKTLFENYQQGKDNLFTIVPDDDLTDEYFENLPQHPPVKWDQQKYLETLQIAYATVAEKPFLEKIRGARFEVPDCEQVLFGPQNAVIFTSSIDYPRITDYSYFIDLSDNSIHWRGYSYDPIISWPVSSVNLSRYEITAEEALQIAEEQGGERTRLANQNQCSINISIDSSHRPGNWVVSYESNIDQFTTVFAISIDANTGQHKIIAQGGAGYYSFDPQQIKKAISDGQTDIFTAQTERPQDDVRLSPQSWTQDDYYQIAQAFNHIVLHEDLEQWKIQSISFELNCDDVENGPQQMRFQFWKIHVMDKHYFVQDILIEPGRGLVTSSYEFDLDVNRFRLFQLQDDVIEESEIHVAGDEALRLVYEAEGKNLHQALREHQKSCKMNGWLIDFSNSMDPESLEWNIGIWKENAEALGERPDQLTAFVSVKTGALHYFKHYYGNLVE